MSNPDNCPHCGASLIGDPIPDDIKENYSGTNWRREIGREDPSVYDGIIEWICPDCNGVWPSEVGKLKGLRKPSKWPY